MSTEAKQKEEIAQKAKAVRDMCSKVEEETKLKTKEIDNIKKHLTEMAGSQKRLLVCTVGFSAFLILVSAASLVFLYNATKDLEMQLRTEYVRSSADSLNELKLLRAEAKQASTQIQDVDKKYVQLLGHHNNLVDRTIALSDEVNKMAQEFNVNKRTISGVDTTIADLKADMEKLASQARLNADVLSTLNKTIWEMSRTMESPDQEKINSLFTNLSERYTKMEEKLENLGSVQSSHQEAYVHNVEFEELRKETARLMDQMKLLEDAGIHRHAEIKEVTDSMKKGLETQLLSLHTETRDVEERLKKIEESVFEYHDTCSDASECHDTRPVDNVRHNSSEL